MPSWLSRRRSDGIGAKSRLSRRSAYPKSGGDPIQNGNYPSAWKLCQAFLAEDNVNGSIVSGDTDSALGFDEDNPFVPRLIIHIRNPAHYASGGSSDESRYFYLGASYKLGLTLFRTSYSLGE